jgi:hypothetical protein
MAVGRQNTVETAATNPYHRRENQFTACQNEVETKVNRQAVRKHSGVFSAGPQEERWEVLGSSEGESRGRSATGPTPNH